MKRGILFLLVVVSALVLHFPILSAQNIQNFYFSSLEADYYLSKNTDDESHMRVVEVLTAQFPDYDQNKGIIRAIPHSYQGRELNINVVSVSRNGEPEPLYAQYDSGPFRYIETGTNDYIQGTQVFEIEYTLENVIQDVNNQQELFWDVNGTGWKQQFNEMTARVHLDEALVRDFKNEAICYQGESGSQEPCTITLQQERVTEFKSTRTLWPEETLTFALAFNDDTFAPYNEGFAGIIRSTGILLSALLLFTGVISLVYIKSKNRNAPGRSVIVPEYLPPKDMSVFFAAYMLKSKEKQRGLQAQIMELAIKKNVIIKENEKKGIFGRDTFYSVELVHTDSLQAEERSLITALFGDKHLKGSEYVFKTSDSSLMRALQQLRAKTDKATIASGHRKQISGIWIPLVASVIGGTAALIVVNQLQNLGVVFTVTDYPMALVIAHGTVLLMTVVVYSINPQPLTAKGRGVRDYLEGLRVYISLAEAERLSYLQSPQGASRSAVSTDDRVQVLKLYERLLPYAVLFNLEKEWLKVIGSYYEQQNQAPMWYAGTRTFNSAQLTSAVQSISSSASRSSGSSGFSSSSGAGGGGGGGGGGGR